MGAKRWQLEEKDEEIKMLKRQLSCATQALKELLEFFNRLDQDKIIKRAISRMKEIETGSEPE